VVYADSNELQASDKNSDQGKQLAPTGNQTSEDNHTIQPYVVTYVGQNDMLYHQPDDFQQTHNNKIQPYTETYADPIQAVRSPTETDHTPQEHTTNQLATNVNQPATLETEAQSIPTGANTKPKYENSTAEKGNITTTENKQSPYGMDDSIESPSISRMLYRSESQHAGEDHDASHMLYNKTGEPCNPENLKVKYEVLKP